MGKILLRGLLAIAPLTITIVLLVWIFNQLESIFRKPILYLIGPQYYFPGLGVLTALVLIFFAGIIFNNWVMQGFYKWFEKELKRIPLINTIYNSVTDMMSFFSKGETKGTVVKVDFGGGTHLIGVVTRESFEDLPKDFAAEEEVAVFFPFSYQIGGFIALVPKSKLIPLDVPFEQGIRFIVTAASPSGIKNFSKK